MLDLAAARRQMIEQQVRAWDVLDATVLEAMGRVHREEFAPEGYRDLALADACVPLAHGECMLPPKLDGRMLQALAIQPGESVLEVGTGSGWFAAVLATLGRQVRSLEIHADLAEAARASLERAGIDNVVVENVDAMQLAVESDALALRIRAVAEDNDVAVVENPPLARALHASVEIDEPVPPEHYKAVAQVIGYVMRLRGKIRAN